MRVRSTSLVLAAGIALLLLLGVESREERLARHRNLGKAFYENPTTQAQAVEEFRKALDLNPKSPVDRLNFGLALLRAGKTREGIAELEAVQRQDPSIPHTWFNLGVAYKREGEFDRAAAQFERMVQLVPNEPVSHYNLGALNKLSGKRERSVAEFETAEKLDSNLAAPHFQLFNLYRQAGRQQDAARELSVFQALKKSQEGAAIPEDMEWSYYAEIYERIEPLPSEKPAAEKWDDTKLPGVVDAKTAGLVIADIDGDGRPDLIAFSSSGIRIYSGGMKPVGAPEIRGVVAIAPADFNNDGLADLCVVTDSAAILLANAKGKFREVRRFEGRYRKAVWLDYDHDYDLDLFLLGEKSTLMRNQGEADWADHTADFPFAAGSAISAAVFRVVPDSKGMDLAVSYADHAGVLYRDRLGGKYEATELQVLPAGARGLSAIDLDNDGWIDLVYRGGALRNGGAGFQPASSAGSSEIEVAADFDGDGRMDRAVVHDDGSVHMMLNRTAGKDHWLRVKLEGVRNPKLAHGAEVEVKAGRLYRKKMYDGVPLLFPLGHYAEADTVRITWPNGLIQNEPKQAAGRVYEYKEAQRLSGSCPMVWTWNGREFQFITDVLGVAPLGATSGDGSYFPVDHDEYVSIPGDALRAENGRYDIRITEELSEVSYLDQVGLIAVDHPAGIDIVTNEKFKSPPFPEFRLYGVRERRYPVAARDDRGHDVRDALLKRDGRYPDGFRRTLSGVAEMHSLTLDFGSVGQPFRAAAGLPPGSGRRAEARRQAESLTPQAQAESLAPQALVLHGWVDWADGSTFLAASQESKQGLVPPYLQVRGRDSQWRTVIEDMGMPAGKPKTIAVDLTGKFLSDSREVRIVTNLCVYWDEIYLSDNAAPPPAPLTPLDPATADLRFRGFSPVRVDPGRRQPETFSYAHPRPASFWNPTPGMYTRYGQVDELLREADDRFVIMGSGDELRLEFDATRFPALPIGWKRDFLLLVDGWAKDRDANTAFSQTVEPLPFHRMTQYPYPSSERYPEDKAHREYRERYNNRPALRLIRPLASPHGAGRGPECLAEGSGAGAATQAPLCGQFLRWAVQ